MGKILLFNDWAEVGIQVLMDFNSGGGDDIIEFGTDFNDWPELPEDKEVGKGMWVLDYKLNDEGEGFEEANLRKLTDEEWDFLKKL